MEVRENVAETLIEQEGHVYVSPPQERERALELVAQLLGHPTSGTGGREQLWRGRSPADKRSVQLRRVK